MNSKQVGFHAWFIVFALSCGFLFVSTAPGECGSLTGAFTITNVPDSVNAQPNTGAFQHLLGLPLTMSVVFSDTSTTRYTFLDVYRLEMHATVQSVSFEGDTTPYLHDVVGPSLEQSSLTLNLEHHGTTNTNTLECFVIGMQTQPEFFAVQLIGRSIDVPLDANQYPVLMDYELSGWPAALERIDPETLNTTDIGRTNSGEFHFSFAEGNVKAQHVSLGHLKIHFQGAKDR